MSNENDRAEADALLAKVEEDSTLSEGDARKAAEGGVAKPLPAGDYLVVVENYDAREYKPSDDDAKRGVGSHIAISFRLKVVEPEEFRGKTIFHSVRLHSRGEKDVWRNKRIATIIECGYVTKEALEKKPGETEEQRNAREAAVKELRKFDFRRLLNQTFVYRAGLVKRWSTKVGDMILANDSRDFSGLHAEKNWTDPEWVQKAPMADQTVREIPRKGVSAGSGTVNTAEKAAEEINIDDEEV